MKKRNIVACLLVCAVVSTNLGCMYGLGSGGLRTGCAPGVIVNPNKNNNSGSSSGGNSTEQPQAKYFTQDGWTFATWDDEQYRLVRTKGELSKDLEECVIPSTVDGKPVTSISDGFFEGATFIKSVQLPEKLAKIEENTFKGCTGLQEITFPASVGSIGSSAFEGCTGLTELTIPATLTYIGAEAFKDCANLATVDFGEYQGSVSPSAFVGTAVAAFTVSETNGKYSVVGGQLCSKDGKELFVPIIKNNVCTIPAGVNKLQEGFFDNFEEVEVALAQGNTAFSFSSEGILYNAGKTEFCYVPKKLKVTDVSLPGTIKTIPEDAFKGTNITSLDVRYPLDYIEDYAFSDCKSLLWVEFWQGLWEIGDYAFSGCEKLHTINIPWSVKRIGLNAFRETKLYNTNDKLYYVDNWVVGWNSSGVGSERPKTYTLASTTKGIAENAFSGAAITHITIPASVKYINPSAFWSCQSLTRVTIEGAAMWYLYWGDQKYGTVQWADLQSPETNATYFTSTYDDVNWERQDWIYE